ncbi:hypothetical protein Y032_0278g1167 [Ancylostoma ceylanicum]|uniref:Uncharacterized protein n=1 Tax=Ancylostoma ceylanicum TaxID=53326 RepID=A0A016S742_9BILA|nr:hypothetical protein Y032_0278g1167 [Ancylostoma ceylanicum]
MPISRSSFSSARTFSTSGFFSSMASAVSCFHDVALSMRRRTSLISSSYNTDRRSVKGERVCLPRLSEKIILGE